MKVQLFRQSENGVEVRSIPAIDFTAAWRSQGWSEDRPTLEPESEPISAPSPKPETEPATRHAAAVGLINEATSTSQLVVLPSVGQARAVTLLENRPESGYSDMNQIKSLNADLPLDWKAIAAWEPA